MIRQLISGHLDASFMKLLSVNRLLCRTMKTGTLESLRKRSQKRKEGVVFAAYLARKQNRDRERWRNRVVVVSFFKFTTSDFEARPPDSLEQ